MQYWPYEYDSFWIEFRSSATYAKMTAEYKHVGFCMSELAEYIPSDSISNTHAHATYRSILAHRGFFTYCNFFYLNLLLEKKPTSIIDIGCGANLFKKYVPNIIGLDANGIPAVDIVDLFNESFAITNTQKFESAFSVNALHFIPITELSDQLNRFARLVKPGGRAVAILNIASMIERTDPSFIAINNLFSFDAYIKFISAELTKVNHKIIRLDFATIPLSLSDRMQRSKYRVKSGEGWPLYDDWVNGVVSDSVIINAELKNFKQTVAIDNYHDALDGNIKIVLDI